MTGTIKVYRLFNEGRISLFAAADYSEGSELSCYMESIIDEIVAREKLRKEQKVLEITARQAGEDQI